MPTGCAGGVEQVGGAGRIAGRPAAPCSPRVLKLGPGDELHRDMGWDGPGMAIPGQIFFSADKDIDVSEVQIAQELDGGHTAGLGPQAVQSK